ncbi:response regulator transcription factor [Roseateles sp. DAIF2]|uniref:response regulator n=1 Tax=Roseateles sp. DAIF2 TaxID=2714952 RepID=UPI0018A32649|nr:response regulator transcription factor [Roseateles sp. DAIF2]QPF73565.1 response regulator transcription factor [Roseateles sp. DAIF2]
MTLSDIQPPCTDTRAIRVFVAEDHQITLWGLRQLIDAMQPRMQVVGCASTLPELLAHAELPGADVLLLDLDLGGEDAGAALATLRQRGNAHVLVLTGADNVEQYRSAVLKGARGVVHKSAPAPTILRAIERVSEGEVWLHRALLGEVLGLLTDGGPAPAARPQDPEARRLASLTPREREIIATLLQRSGAKLLSVADELQLSEHTLRNHLTTIYSKLGVRGRLELHVYASAHGLAGPLPPARAGGANS